MTTETVPFTRPVVTPEAQLAGQRSLASGWLTSGPECAAFEKEFASWLGRRRGGDGLVVHRRHRAVACGPCTCGRDRSCSCPRSRSAAWPGPCSTPVTSPCSWPTSIPSPDRCRRRPSVRRPGAVDGVEAMVVLHYAGAPPRSTSWPQRPASRCLGSSRTPLTRSGTWAGTPPRGQQAPGPPASASTPPRTCRSVRAGWLPPTIPSWPTAIRCGRLHGMSRDAWRRYEPGGSWRYDVVEDGIKANLPDVAAAVGRVQLTHVDEWQKRRTAIALAYQDALGRGSLDLLLPTRTPRRAARVAPVRRPGDRAVTRSPGTSCRRSSSFAASATSVHFIPLHHLTYTGRRPCSRCRCAAPTTSSRSSCRFPCFPH